MPLTDQKIRSLKPKMRSYKCADERGLYVEVTPTGGKWWRFKYRFAGKEKRISVGTYPDISLKDARARRESARKELSQGRDPSATRKARQAAKSVAMGNSFAIVAKEFLAKFSSRWSASHRFRTIRLLERDVSPWIGASPITEIDAPAILRVARRIEARGAVDSAHRCIQVCGQVFRYAVATGRALTDPTRDLKGALPPKSSKHFAATTEPKKLGPILRAMFSYQGSHVVRCALRLAPMLFVRPGELRRAKWSEIDLVAAEWRFRVSKTETEHIVPLAKQALEVLRELQPATGDGTYVFPGMRSRLRPMSDNAVLVAMRSLGIGKSEMTGHGFRAAARTILDEVLGIRPELIEHQLAHAVRDPNGRAYNRTAHLEKRREMMQAWADFLEALTSK